MHKIKAHYFTTGYCTAHERIAIATGRWKEIKFEATCVLLDHPKEGLILFDTGYTPRFFEVTKTWPDILYAKLTPVFCNPEWTIKNQIEQLGFRAKDVKHILISHFHADHIGGLKDFGNCQFWASKKAYEEVESLNGFAAVKKGILKGLIPDDFKERIRFYEDTKCVNRRDVFDCHYDIFEDESLKIIDLPGHARGQVGVFFMDKKSQEVLLAADAFWLSESIEKNILPSKIIKVFIDSWEEYKTTFQKIISYKKEKPATKIISCHCPSVEVEDLNLLKK